MRIRVPLGLLLWAFSLCASGTAQRSTILVTFDDIAATRASALRVRTLLQSHAPDTHTVALAHLGGLLLDVPAAARSRVEQVLAEQAYVLHVDQHGPAHSPLPPTEPASVLAPRSSGVGTGVVIGLLDNGLAANNPLLQAPGRRFHFEPRLAAHARGELWRSHGTAMFGIYAQLAAGRSLIAADRAQSAQLNTPPFALTDVVVARAGAETRAGRGASLVALDWILGGRHPRPQIINYSQGNGALCEDDDRACRGTTWAGMTRLIDRAIEHYKLVLVKSAGNAGFSPHATTVTVPGDTFNGITVGNVHSFDYANCTASKVRARHRIYHTSSVAAPGGDAPRLLDVVAPGVRVRTAGVDPRYCRARCDRPSGPACRICARLALDTDRAGGVWKENSGSSPAAAIVGAAAASLIALGLRDPLAIKALLINSATSWTSAGQPPATRVDGICRDAVGHGPVRYGAHYDRSYGWGYLDSARAAQERPFVAQGELEFGGSDCYRVRIEPWHKLTLAWPRHVGRCASCTREWRLSRLEFALYDAATLQEIDRDRMPSAYDNVLQVSNGRGSSAQPRERAIIVRIWREEQAVDAVAKERYALAGPRRLSRLATCPAFAP